MFVSAFKPENATSADLKVPLELDGARLSVDLTRSIEKRVALTLPVTRADTEIILVEAGYTSTAMSVMAHLFIKTQNMAKKYGF